MSGHHQDWKEITIGKRPSSTGGGSAKAAKDPKAVAAVRARDDDERATSDSTRHDTTRHVVTIGRFDVFVAVVDARWERTDEGDE